MAVERIPRHNVFISYHEMDREYKDTFVQLMDDRIIDRSVRVDDLDEANPGVESIRRNIRDSFIRYATVTVVLVGPFTWQRMYVDWEISSSLHGEEDSPKCGLLGILLPNHPNYHLEGGNIDYRLVPPRLVDNCGGDDPYARIYKWPCQWDPEHVQQWIHEAFNRRDGAPPDNSRKQFNRNLSGDCSRGWRNQDSSLAHSL